MAGHPIRYVAQYQRLECSQSPAANDSQEASADHKSQSLDRGMCGLDNDCFCEPSHQTQHRAKEPAQREGHRKDEDILTIIEQPGLKEECPEDKKKRSPKSPRKTKGKSRTRKAQKLLSVTSFAGSIRETSFGVRVQSETSFDCGGASG